VAFNSNPKAQRLRALLARKDRVLSVLHPPSAALARIMERAGCEAGFVGTSAVVGGITGLADVGTATMSECVQIGRWIAGAVDFPVILDGDTGHGGVMAVRRLVRECIEAGLAGIRIDDQPIEGKRRTQSAGVEVVPLDQAIARYRAAVDMKNELDGLGASWSSPMFIGSASRSRRVKPAATASGLALVPCNCNPMMSSPRGRDDTGGYAPLRVRSSKGAV